MDHFLKSLFANSVHTHHVSYQVARYELVIGDLVRTLTVNCLTHYHFFELFKVLIQLCLYVT